MCGWWRGWDADGGATACQVSSSITRRHYPPLESCGASYVTTSDACRQQTGNPQWFRWFHETGPAHLIRRPGTKLSLFAALAGRTGTKLSQYTQNGPFRCVWRQQGELCTARATNNPSWENFVPHTRPRPGQNSPSRRLRWAHPVQNSPNTPKNADFGAFDASRENFVPLEPPTTRAGRTLYRMHVLAAVPVGGRANTRQKSHVIRLNEVSTKSRNVAIPTT